MKCKPPIIIHGLINFISYNFMEECYAKPSQTGRHVNWALSPEPPSLQQKGQLQFLIPKHIDTYLNGWGWVWSCWVGFGWFGFPFGMLSLQLLESAGKLAF